MVTSVCVGSVDGLETGSPPAIASPPPWRPVPAKLACLKMSPQRSTPGPLPYHTPSTPSYFGRGKRLASWLPKMAVAPRSSLRPEMNTTWCSRRRSGLRSKAVSSPPSGEPRYPDTRVAVRSPRRRSARCWSNGRRARARGPDGGGVDPPPPPPLAHPGQPRLGAEEGPLEIHVEDQVPLLLRHLGGHRVPVDPGIVDQDVHPPPGCGHLADHFFYFGLLGHVARHGQGLRAGRLDFLGDLLRARRIGVVDRHQRPFPGEALRRRFTDPAGPPRAA